MENKDTEQYYNMSIKEIDRLCLNGDYNKAFGLLILVLERLDEKERTELIKYYSNNKKLFK